MAQSPTPPYFSYNRQHHRIELSDNVETKLEVPLQNIIREADVSWIIYDASGLAWSFRYTKPPGGFSLLSRLLAHPLFSLFLFMREIASTWTRRQPYQLSELGDGYLRGIAHDEDGWLTRFVDEADLKRRVQACQTFEELVLTWRWTKTETPDDNTGGLTMRYSAASEGLQRDPSHPVQRPGGHILPALACQN